MAASWNNSGPGCLLGTSAERWKKVWCSSGIAARCECDSWIKAINNVMRVKFGGSRSDLAEY